MSFQKMYGFEGVGLSEVQLSISELSVVGGWVVGGAQTHFMVGPSQGPTKRTFIIVKKYFQISHLDLVAVGDWVGLQVCF